MVYSSTFTLMNKTSVKRHFTYSGFVFFFCVLSFSNLMSQDLTNDNEPTWYYGKVYSLKGAEAAGNPYFNNTTLFKGEIYFNSCLHKDVIFGWDLLTDEIFIQIKPELGETKFLSLPLESIEWCNIYGANNIKLQVVNQGDTDAYSIAPGVYEEVFSNVLTLLRNKKSTIEMVEGASRYVESSTLWLSDSQGIYREITKLKDLFHGIDPETKNRIKVFLKENKIKYAKAEDSELVEIAQYIESLDEAKFPAVEADFDQQRTYQLHTDRDIYFTGEKLWFSIHDFKNKSSLAFLEIVGPYGLIDTKKVIVNKGKTFGLLVLADTLTSGIYSLNGFRNLVGNAVTPDDFKLIQIINPYKKPKIINDQVISVGDIKDYQSKFPEGVTLSIDKDQVIQREKVNVKITAEAVGLQYGAVSVRKKLFVLPANLTRQDINTPELPEGNVRIGRNTLKGKLRDTKSDPLINEPIQVYFAGNEAFMNQTISDKNGQFEFDFPTRNIGKRDMIFVTPQYPDPINVELFSSRSMGFYPDKVFEFQFDTSNMVKWDQAFLNWQLNKAFSKKVEALNINRNRSDSLADFYGQPYARAFVDSYIKLKNVAELFKEVGFGVKINGKEGEEEISILPENFSIHKRNEPLVLFNGYPLRNPNDVLTIPLNILNYFDVIRSEFYIGNQSFGGILNVVSTDATLNLKEPVNAYRSVEEITSYVCSFKPANYEKDWNENTPNLLPTLYWDPDFSLEKNANKTINLFVGDDTGTFEVNIKGMTTEGEFFEISQTFEVLERTDSVTNK